MWPMIANSRPIANQSCTNVAPWRHESENGPYNFRIKPVINITTIDAPMKVALQLLTRIELAELHVRPAPLRPPRPIVTRPPIQPTEIGRGVACRHASAIATSTGIGSSSPA